MKKQMGSLILGVALMTQAPASVAQTSSETSAAIVGGGNAPVSTIAANSVSTSTTQLSQKKKDNKTQNFHFLINLESSSNMYRADSLDRQASTDLLLNPLYKINDVFSMTAKTAISKDETGARNTSVSNTSVSLRMKGYEFGSGKITGSTVGSPAALSHSIALIIPTNEDSQKIDRLQGALAIGNGISFKFLNVDSKYVITVQKNIHEFTVNADGDANVEYSLRHDLSFDIELTPTLTLSPSGYYKQGWTYHQFNRNSYGLGLDLNYEVVKDFVVYVGSGNEGAGYKANGTETNIKAFDQNTSVLRAGLSYTY